jgi:Spy/CpxP family protein refolding chaperone
MKTMNRKTVVLATLAILVFVASTALAQRPQRRADRERIPDEEQVMNVVPEAPGPRWERLAENLGLTEEQQTAIQELRATNRAKNLELRKEMARLRNELEGELLKDEVDEAAALKLARRIGDLRTEMRTNGLATRLAVRAQLTPEQRDKMLTAGAGFGRGGGRHGRCDGHGPRHGGCGRGQGRGGHRECRFDDD